MIKSPYCIILKQLSSVINNLHYLSHVEITTWKLDKWMNYEPTVRRVAHASRKKT